VPSASVIICAYSDERLNQLGRALDSVIAQTAEAFEVIAVIDHNPGLRRQIANAYPSVKVIANNASRGLSGARNSGIREAAGEIVAFLDDDAIAGPNWLADLFKHYADPQVMGVGGGVIAIWPEQRPRWLPDEFNWVVGCSYRGQPLEAAEVRNPIGCNMSFRREVFSRIGGFREGIGRTASDAAGCEETEVCIRLRREMPGAIIIYDPVIEVQHHVSKERTRWQYFRKRCLAEGRSKTVVVGEVGSRDGLASERHYITRTLPAGVLRGLGEAFINLDPWALARAAGICAGLSYTAWGYFGSKLSSGRR
jgi:GT2 family glycosyltransferase